MTSRFFSFLLIGFLGFFLLFNSSVASPVNITAIVNPVCGNTVAESGEECDGSDFAGKSCSTFGFNSGSLSCTASCTIVTTGCSNVAPPSGGGGGGGSAPISTILLLSGYAYPGETVTVLKDVAIAASVRTQSDGTFSISVSNLSGGNYMFSVYGEDRDGNRSSLYTFPVAITAGTTTNLSGIFIAPTIALDKSEVKRGDSIAIFGQSSPQASITIIVGSEQEYFVKTDANADGIYRYYFDTVLLDDGAHTAKAKAVLGNQLISNTSRVLSFKVGSRNILALAKQETGESDLNGDDRVNLIDFSVVAYWYKRANPPAKVDLNSDGKIDLVDFSIMAFYWTG